MISHEGKTVRYLALISSFIILVAVITINASFSFPDEVNNKQWNIYIDSVDYDMEYKISDNSINYQSYIDINTTESIMKFSAINVGEYDAYLSNIKLTDLSNIIINGISVDTLVEYDTTYLENLDSNRFSNIIITIKLKDDLSKEQLDIVKNGLNLNINVNLEYQQRI